MTIWYGACCRTAMQLFLLLNKVVSEGLWPDARGTEKLFQWFWQHLHGYCPPGPQHHHACRLSQKLSKLFINSSFTACKEGTWSTWDLFDANSCLWFSLLAVFIFRELFPFRVPWCAKKKTHTTQKQLAWGKKKEGQGYIRKNLWISLAVCRWVLQSGGLIRGKQRPWDLRRNIRATYAGVAILLL